MKSLISLEWQRLKGFRFFWMFLSGYFLCLLVTMWAGTRLVSEFFSGIQVSGLTSLSFAQSVAVIFYFSGFFESFLALILIMIISNDYALGTLKQHVIEGLSYEQVVVGRALQVLLLVLIGFAMVMGLSVIFAGQLSGGELTFPATAQVGAFLLRSLGTLSLSVLLVSIIKKAIPTVLAYYGLSFILEPALGYFLNSYFQKDFSTYLPLEVFASLVPSPKAIFANQLASQGLSGSGDGPAVSMFLFAGLYLFAFWVAIFAVVKLRRFR